MLLKQTSKVSDPTKKVPHSNKLILKTEVLTMKIFFFVFFYSFFIDKSVFGSSVDDQLDIRWVSQVIQICSIEFLGH
jgi:hypothetical protein